MCYYSEHDKRREKNMQMAVDICYACQPASLYPSSANSTLILLWDATAPLLKATRFVRVTPPSCREQTQDSGQAWGAGSGLAHDPGSIHPGTWLKLWARWYFLSAGVTNLGG